MAGLALAAGSFQSTRPMTNVRSASSGPSVSRAASQRPAKVVYLRAATTPPRAASPSPPLLPRPPFSPLPACPPLDVVRRPADTMSKASKYLLVSLPTSIAPSNDREEALTALRSTVSNDVGTTYPFQLPNFKIGTLDALVQQADDLAKLNNACEQVVNKVGDSLRGILDNDEEKIAQQKTINDSACMPPTTLENSC